MAEDRGPMTYAGSGVDYSAMDPFKLDAQKAASETAQNLEAHGLHELSWTRGESVYLAQLPDGSILAHVEEGLGTKNLVADAIASFSARSYYDSLAQDTVAMIVNDMITLGALPVSMAMHLAVGDADWFKNIQRTKDLINGWRRSCDLAGCAWSCGETPTLKGIIMPGAALLSGSAVGIIKRGRTPSRKKLTSGDQIVLLGSSGIHANGLTLARRIADELPGGYKERLSDGRPYGEALLDPTHIYVPVIRDCLNQGIDVFYAVNITGHGWRKLMRATESCTYIIERIPEPQPVFRFIQEHGPVTDEEAYANLNMGAGFALYVSRSSVNKVIEIAGRHGFFALHAGRIEEGEKKVVIEPLDLVFTASTLAVR